MSAEHALDQVADAAAVVRQANRDLRGAVADAQTQGATIESIADAATVTRQTIYRWLRQETGAPSGLADTRVTLDRALDVLADLIDETNRPTVEARRRHHDIGVKVLGIRIGNKSLPIGITRRLTDDESMVLQAGNDAAREAYRIHERTGKWPDRVRLGEGPGRPQAQDPADDETGHTQ